MFLSNMGLKLDLLDTEKTDGVSRRLTDSQVDPEPKYKPKGKIWIPEAMKPRSWIVTGTPGAGKSYLLKQIGAIPGEICIDIAMKKWWTIPPLAQRPREVHFALPFKDYKDSYPLYDEAWTQAEDLPEVDLESIRIPRKKKYILAPDWRARFVFDFIMPPPDWIYEIRRNRLAEGDGRLVDVGITNRLATWQTQTLWRVASHFDASGLQVLVRPFNLAYPYTFPELRSFAGQPEWGSRSVFPEGVDMDVEITLREWIRKTAPKEWQEMAAKGTKDT